MARLFLDLDGVLADFDRGVLDLTGKLPDDQPMKDMWRACAFTDNFFTNLNWMHDGEVLWTYCERFNPTILTGIPHGNWAPKQKRTWCGNRLGWTVPVITCWSKEKYLHALPGDVLVDDRHKARSPWEDAGGVFIHHVNAVETIAQLKELGF